MRFSYDFLNHLLARLFRVLAEIIQVIKGGPKLNSEGCSTFVFEVLF